MMNRKLAAFALVATLGTPIAASFACQMPEGIDLTAADAERMDQFDTARSRGMAEAMLGTIEEERAAVAALFASGVEAIEAIPDGDYRCRTIKMGGISPLVVYGYFACEISEDGAHIEKTSGSQRFNGSLMPTDGGLFYQGAQHYNDDPLRRYGEDEEFNQVGCLYRVASQSVYRLELPYPVHESTHDVIELIPAN
jgi:hypothetical protein